MLPQNCFVFSRSDVGRLERSRLYGLGITHDALIFGSKGLAEYEAAGGREIPSQGSFAGVFARAGKIVIRADVTGQEVIYVYKANNDWVVSNSFALVVQQAALTRRLAPYEPALHGFHLKDGVHIGEQLLGHKTPVEDIYILPLTSELHIDPHDGALSQVDKPFAEQFPIPSERDYPEVLLDALERGAGAMAALIGTGMPVNQMLSGGYDSRLATCLLLASNGDFSRVRVSSHQHKKDDYKAAEAICRRLKLPLNVPPPPKRRNTLSAGDAFRLYLLSCAGVYLPIYPVQAYTTYETAELTITGDQPYAAGHFAGPARFNGSAAKIAEDIRLAMSQRDNVDQDTAQALADDFLSTFDVIGVPAEHAASMAALYAATRSRLHGGRAWYKSLGNQVRFSPLMTPQLMSAGLYHVTHTTEADLHGTDTLKSLYADAFSVFGGWALEEAFETPSREFPKMMLENSPFKGGADVRPKHFSVYGKPWDDESPEEPDIFSIPVRFKAPESGVRDALAAAFAGAELAKESGYFLPTDLQAAESEVRARASLSHNYRKTAHVIGIDSILRLCT